ncbi:MAG: GIY-YIG nuclease family protein [Bacteroidota bacterium]|nr:GIY-YIG nuclease family protein [Bacteroidota bacterium]
MYFVYILQSKKIGQYYVGHTDNLERRMSEHDNGKSPYTKGRGPWTLVNVEEFATRSEAMKREKEIKGQKSREFIERLINKKQLVRASSSVC